jgi:hypothetical protein
VVNAETASVASILQTWTVSTIELLDEKGVYPGGMGLHKWPSEKFCPSVSLPIAVDWRDGSQVSSLMSIRYFSSAGNSNWGETSTCKDVTFVDFFKLSAILLLLEGGTLSEELCLSSDSTLHRI